MFQLSAFIQLKPVYLISEVAGRNLIKPCIPTLLFCQPFYFAIEDISVVCIDPPAHLETFEHADEPLVY